MTTPELSIDDRVLCRLAVVATTRTAGVARLQPTVGRRLARNALELTRGDRSGAGDAALAAVDLERADGAVRLSVRIVATGEPTLLDTVAAIHLAITATIGRHTGLAVEVCVLVIDCEPANTVMA